MNEHSVHNDKYVTQTDLAKSKINNVSSKGLK